MELDQFGGVANGNLRQTTLMCPVMKMLQILPEKDIVVEFIKNDYYKTYKKCLENGVEEEEENAENDRLRMD